MADAPFLIYKSSAGSGKTYTLAREYLKLSLSNPSRFSSILAVTFTNKATEEMKQRIVGLLKEIISGEQKMLLESFEKDLEMTRQQLQENASILLTKILHGYDRFAIATIDSFFHQVIRSFAREMGLQGSFTIDLDTSSVMQKVVDELLSALGEKPNKRLRHWLTQFAENKVEEGKSWDFRNDINKLAKETIKEAYKPFAAEIRKLSDEENFNEEIIKELNKIRYSFENHCKSLAQTGLHRVEEAGGMELFKNKSSGPAGLFNKFLNKSYEISEKRRDATNNLDSWLKKEQMSSPIQTYLEDRILPVYNQLVSFFDAKFLEYKSAVEVLRYFYTFGILSEINLKLQQYRDDNDLMLIADLPDFLRQIINDSETPYIYEKVGNRYDHFLIDEFQDTSTFQWQNFKPLVKNATDAVQKSMVVGDIKQSIYRWRGGDLNLLNDTVKHDIGEYHTMEYNLESNWRSSPDIVHFNNYLFNDIRSLSGNYFEGLDPAFNAYLDKFLSIYDQVEQHPKKEDLPGAIHIEYLPNEKEDDWERLSIEKTIGLVEQIQKKEYNLSDIAILTRTQKEGKKIADAFLEYKNGPDAKEDCKYDVVSSEALFLYSSHAVRFIVSMIKWLQKPDDPICLSEWFFEYKRYILESEPKDHDLFEKSKSWRQYVPVEFTTQIGYLKTLPVYELVSTLIRIFNLHDLINEYTYLQGFQDAVLDFSKNERGDIISFLEWWEQIRKDRSIQISDDNNAIKVLTIHKAKGLEFPVVIIPFLSWQLDHNVYANEQILWCKPPDRGPFNRFPVIPLRYSQGLKDTYWARQYWEEHISAFIDNLNLLYVSFTRPRQVLVAFSPQEKNTKKNKIGALIYDQLKSHDLWEQHHLSINEIPQKSKKETSNLLEYGLKDYINNPWKSKIHLQMRGSGTLSDRAFNIQQKGIQIHGLLSRIRFEKDIEKYRDHELFDEVKGLLNKEEVSVFFNDLDEVRVEVPILLPGGEYKRIDRLVRKGNTWFIIDFKSGKPREKDREQVMEYKNILQEMGRLNISGRLIYLEPLKVVEV